MKRVAVPLVLILTSGLALACPGEKMQKDAKAALTESVAATSHTSTTSTTVASVQDAAPAREALVKATAKAEAPKAAQAATVVAAKPVAGSY